MYIGRLQNEISAEQSRNLGTLLVSEGSTLHDTDSSVLHSSFAFNLGSTSAAPRPPPRRAASAVGGRFHILRARVLTLVSPPPDGDAAWSLSVGLLPRFSPVPSGHVVLQTSLEVDRVPSPSALLLSLR